MSLLPRNTKSTVLAGLLIFTCVLQAPAGPRPEGGGRLADAASPYLRMHADNPVAWYPWGEEAFELAEREQKPLFISVGYFTCHWCHVMERESFMDPAIARLLNQHFVAVKIDREQRPDIDAAYMRFVTATGGAGGWPLNVFATPEGYPIAGGSYFPPTGRDGQTGFRELLERVHRLWNTDRQRIEATAAAAVLELRRLEQAAPAAGTAIDPGLPAAARRELSRQYDELTGGFGDAPRFPRAPQLLFLLQSPAAQDRNMALHTLDAMAEGGLRDQLGGGFHRYAIDPLWRVPHFEKMLYDQALNARALIAAARISGEQHYAGLARETLDFALANMRNADGAFHAAWAADSLPRASASHPEEGAYYTWDRQQWQSALPDATLRRLAAARYGFESRGNVGEAALAGRNVLYLATPLDKLGREFGLEPQRLRTSLQQAQRQLLAARAQRPPVAVDTKLVTAWNAYMITALAEAAAAFGEPRYLSAATQATEALLQRLYDPEEGRLHRDFSAGVRGVAGFAGDYAALTEAALALFAASEDPRWLTLADALTDTQIALFWDHKAGGFFNNRADSRVWLRDKQAWDGAEPGVNSISLGNLLQLARLTDAPELADKARQTAAWASVHLSDTPAAMPYTLLHWPALLQVTRAP